MIHERYFKPESYAQPTFVHPLIREMTEIRRAWKLTRQDIAARAGYAYTTICHVEAGQRYPGLRLLQDWADVLGYEVVLRPKKKPEFHCVPEIAGARGK